MMRWNSKSMNPLCWKTSLVGQIMNRINGFGPGDFSMVQVLSFEQQGHHAGLPVMAMDDVDLLAEPGGGFQGRTIK